MKRNQWGIIVYIFAIVVIFVGCNKKDKEKSYTIDIGAPEQQGAKATFTIARSGGNIEPSEYGLVYSKNSGPTTSDTKVTISGSSETKTIKGLDLSTTYYARGFVTDSKGTHYSSEVTFTTYCMDLDSISPRSAAVGATITVYGRGFGTVSNEVYIRKFDSSIPAENLAQPASITNTQLTFVVPGTFTVGKVYNVGVIRYTTGCNTGYYNDTQTEPLLLLTVTN